MQPCSIAGCGCAEAAVGALGGALQAGKGSSDSLTGAQVKAVCSSGGHFVKLSGGGFEYQGGETRLIAVPNFCQFSELAEALERIAGNAAAFSSASSEQVIPLSGTQMLRCQFLMFLYTGPSHLFVCMLCWSVRYC